jgi:hypothetical protein
MLLHELGHGLLLLHLVGCRFAHCLLSVRTSLVPAQSLERHTFCWLSNWDCQYSSSPYKQNTHHHLLDHCSCFAIEV